MMTEKYVLQKVQVTLSKTHWKVKNIEVMSVCTYMYISCHTTAMIPGTVLAGK